MNKKIALLISAMVFLAAGFLAGAYQASNQAITVKADPYDEMPGYGYMYNGTYYGGYGMGMGMGMMGMMGPMYGYGMPMNGYPMNNNYGMYGGAPMGNYSYYNDYGMGMMGMCGGMMGGYGMNNNPYYYPNPTPPMNMTASNFDNKAVILSDDRDDTTTPSQETQAISPFVVAALGLGLIVCVPLTWKVLTRKSKNKN